MSAIPTRRGRATARLAGVVIAGVGIVGVVAATSSVSKDGLVTLGVVLLGMLAVGCVVAVAAANLVARREDDTRAVMLARPAGRVALVVAVLLLAVGVVGLVRDVRGEGSGLWLLSWLVALLAFAPAAFASMTTKECSATRLKA